MYFIFRLDLTETWFTWTNCLHFCLSWPFFLVFHEKWLLLSDFLQAGLTCSHVSHIEVFIHYYVDACLYMSCESKSPSYTGILISLRSCPMFSKHYYSDPRLLGLSCGGFFSCHLNYFLKFQAVDSNLISYWILASLLFNL